MIKTELARNYRKIENLILENRLKDALEMLKDLVIKSRKGDYISQYETMDETYENLLKYTIEGIDDPERDKIYKRLQVSVLELSDVALQYAYMNESDQYIYQLKKKIEYESKQIKEQVIDNIESLAFDDELSEILKNSIDVNSDDKDEYLKHQEILVRIFNLIWLTDKFKDTDIKMVRSIWEAKNFPWYECSIIISALTYNEAANDELEPAMLTIDGSIN